LGRADALRLLELAERLALELDLERIRRQRAEFLLRVNYRKEERRSLAAAKARGTLLGSARADHWQGREEAGLAGLEKARNEAAIAG
jgi:hypothetical protein